MSHFEVSARWGLSPCERSAIFRTLKAEGIGGKPFRTERGAEAAAKRASIPLHKLEVTRVHRVGFDPLATRN